MQANLPRARSARKGLAGPAAASYKTAMDYRAERLYRAAGGPFMVFLTSQLYQGQAWICIRTGAISRTCVRCEGSIGQGERAWRTLHIDVANRSHRLCEACMEQLSQAIQAQPIAEPVDAPAAFDARLNELA